MLQISNNIYDKPIFSIKIKYNSFIWEKDKVNVLKSISGPCEMVNLLTDIENYYIRLISKKHTREQRYFLLLLKKGIWVARVRNKSKKKIKSTINRVVNYLKPYGLYNNAPFTNSRKRKLFNLIQIRGDSVRFNCIYVDKNNQGINISTEYMPFNRYTHRYVLQAYIKFDELIREYIIFPKFPDITSTFMHFFVYQKMEVYETKKIKVYLTNTSVSEDGKQVYSMDIVSETIPFVNIRNIPVIPLRSQNVGNYVQKYKNPREGLPKDIVNLIKTNETIVFYPDKLGVLPEELFKITFAFNIKNSYFCLSLYSDVYPPNNYSKLREIMDYIKNITGNLDGHMAVKHNNAKMYFPVIDNKPCYHAEIITTSCKRSKRK